MTLAATQASPQLLKNEHFVFHGVGWGFYQHVLRAVENLRVFVTYDRGELEIMAPAQCKPV